MAADSLIMNTMLPVPGFSLSNPKADQSTAVSDTCPHHPIEPLDIPSNLMDLLENFGRIGAIILVPVSPLAQRESRVAATGPATPFQYRPLDITSDLAHVPIRHTPNHGFGNTQMPIPGMYASHEEVMPGSSPKLYELGALPALSACRSGRNAVKTSSCAQSVPSSPVDDIQFREWLSGEDWTHVHAASADASDGFNTAASPEALSNTTGPGSETVAAPADDYTKHLGPLAASQAHIGQSGMVSPVERQSPARSSDRRHTRQLPTSLRSSCSYTSRGQVLTRLPCTVPSCHKTFTTTKDLKRHRSSVHSSRRQFRCSECPYSSPRRDNFSRHLRTMSRSAG